MRPVWLVQFLLNKNTPINYRCFHCLECTSGFVWSSPPWGTSWDSLMILRTAHATHKWANNHTAQIPDMQCVWMYFTTNALANAVKIISWSVHLDYYSFKNTFLFVKTIKKYILCISLYSVFVFIGLSEVFWCGGGWETRGVLQTLSYYKHTTLNPCIFKREDFIC